MKSILLTGGTGFLGSKVATSLSEAGYQLTILVRRESNLERIRQLQRTAEISLVEDIDSIFVRSTPFFAVVHTATDYGRNKNGAFDAFFGNTAFPMRLLQKCADHGTQNFISTDSFFNTGSLDYDYLSSYSLSKQSFNNWGKVIGNSGILRFINIRLEHIFGPNDGPQKFTAQIINSCLKNNPEINLTPGNQKRDFIYIDDAVSAYQAIINNLDSFPISYREFGVGLGQPISVKDFVLLVHELTNSESKLNFGALPHRKGEIMHSAANLEELNKLGWVPQFSVREGLQKLLQIEMKGR